MKFRVHVWRSPTGSRPDAYGIQGQHQPGQRYKHVRSMVGGVFRALIYKTRKRAEEVAAGLNTEGVIPDIFKGLTPLANRRRAKR